MTRTVIDGATTLISIEGAPSAIQLGSPGLDGVPGRGIKAMGYDPASGQVSLTLTDDSSLIIEDLRGSHGAAGVGVAETTYDPATGLLRITLTDGQSMVTGDLRGPRGTGLEGGRYEPATGRLVLTLTDGQAVATGDLRGPQGLPGPANLNIDGGGVTGAPPALVFDGGSP
ncbi:hypothetical protein ACEYYB_09640 [Paracoccus sp. p4-l81]|uniref:hypothetical protein n=1 Tax=Paracoccus sp. p4-l81 TaxID=3342806 RepID=UPI0035B90305